MGQSDQKPPTPVWFAKLSVYREWSVHGVILTPSRDEWNDFALRTRFDVRFIRPDGSRFEEVLLLGFIETTQSPEELVRLNLEKKAGALSAGDLPAFFTLRPSLEAYRNIVQQLGVSDARIYLRATRDLVAAQLERRPPVWFRNAQNTEVFARSFMRSSESFFAFHNAKSILRGTEEEQFDGISTGFRLEFKLPTFGNPHHLELSFAVDDPVLPSRLSVIIGENGTGKSQALHQLVRSALANDQRFRTSDGERPRVNRLLAIDGPGEVRSTFPRERRGGGQRMHYQRISLSPNRDSSSGLGQILIRLARLHEELGGKSRWQLFLNSINRILPTNEIFLRLKRAQGPLQTSSSAKTSASLAELARGSYRDALDLWSRVNPRLPPMRRVQNKLVPLSSGQLTFLHFAAQLCLQVENGTLLLLDEPETHLHPNLITEFVGLLSQILADTGSLALIATHSAYFVRETRASQVVVLRERTPGFIEVSQPRLKTLGAEVGAISRFVFGSTVPSLLLAQAKQILAEHPEKRRSRLKQLAAHLPIEAQMFLSQEMEGEEP